jgi:hypothetical protein
VKLLCSFGVEGCRARAIARRTPKQKQFYRNIVQQALCTFKTIQNLQDINVLLLQVTCPTQPQLMYEVEHPQGTNKLYAQYSCGEPRSPRTRSEPSYIWKLSLWLMTILFDAAVDRSCKTTPTDTPRISPSRDFIRSKTALRLEQHYHYFQNSPCRHPHPIRQNGLGRTPQNRHALPSSRQFWIARLCAWAGRVANVSENPKALFKS